MVLLTPLPDRTHLRSVDASSKRQQITEPRTRIYERMLITSFPVAHSPHEKTALALRVRRRRPRSFQEVQGESGQVLPDPDGHGRLRYTHPGDFSNASC